MSEGPAALERVSTTQALERELVRRILNGEFAPGMRLREADIAASYGVGRHTVRAAFQELSHIGIAVYEPNRGVSVLEPTPEVAADVFTLRAAIETEAVRRIFERGASLDGMRAALDSLQALPSDVSWAELVEADLAVHEALVVASGSARMHQVFLDLVNQVMLVLIFARSGDFTVADEKTEHAAIVAALESGDSDRAVKVVRTHLYEMVRG